MDDRDVEPNDSSERRSLGDRMTNRDRASEGVGPRGARFEGQLPRDTFFRPQSSLQLAEGSLLGSFRVERRLGRGGMGEVWKAYDTVGERYVVVKVLPAELHHNPDEMARVKHTFQRIHDLHHQHICPVYLLGEEPALGYYLVMRYVEGMTLAAFHRDYVARKSALPLEQVCRVLEPVAQALDYAHSHKVVHRDIKPQNIMVCEGGSDVQVVDFGLAAEIRTSVTRVSRVRMDSSGTYPYMAPEQWRGEYQDGAADQYALGVVAFELLTDRLPYEAPDDFVLRQCVLHEPVPEIRDQPGSVNEALKRALAKKRGDRFENCTAFIRALGQPQQQQSPRDEAKPIAPARSKNATHKVEPSTGKPRGRHDATRQVEAPGRDQAAIDKEAEERRLVNQRLLSLIAQKAANDQELASRRGGLSPEQRREAQRRRESEEAAQRALRQGGILIQPSDAGSQSTESPQPRQVDEQRQRAAKPAEPPGEVRRFEGHTNTVLSVCFSPDGRTILSGSADRMAQIWDSQTGNWLYRFTEPRLHVASAVFSPDGKRVLAGAGNMQLTADSGPGVINEGMVRLYDVSTWQELRRFAGHTASVRSVAFSSDGRLALTGGFDQSMRMWDVETGRELRTFNHSGGWLSDNIRVLTVAFSPDRRFAVSGNNDRTIRLWDVQTGEEVRRFEGHAQTVPCVTFSPDGRRLLSAGCADKTMRLWDVATGRELRRFDGHTGNVWSVAFSPDGRRALSGSGEIRNFGFLWLKRGPFDCALRLWDVETGVALHRFEGFTTPVLSVAFSPDGRFALSGSGGVNTLTGGAVDCAIRMWRLPR